MKVMKGVLAALVAVFVSHAGLAASGTETVGDYTWSWKTSSGGGVVITAVDPQPSGELTIPTQLNSEAVVELQSSLFYNAPITAVTIPGTVRKIGERAFALETRNSSFALSLRFAGDRPELMGVGAEGVFCGANGFVTSYVPETDSWSAELSAGKWDLANVKPIAEHSDSFSDFTYQMGSGQYYVTGVNSTPPAGAWLVVPATHSTLPVTAIAPNAFKDLTQVSAIVLPDSIRTIGQNAFDGCTGLGELILPASVTTLNRTALTNCTSLASVTFKGSMPSASGLYDGLSESLVTYASWETDYASWKTAVADGTWNERPIAWARPIEEAWAQGVAVYRSDLTALVFYADGRDHSSEGPLYLLANAEAKETGGLSVMPWAGQKANVTRVIFDASFASARPKHCAKWFDGFTQLATVDGLEYLDVSEATSLRRMFAGCTALTTLNLTNFDTSAVTDMSDMFAGCSSLTTIYALNTFVTTALESDTQSLFTGCTSLVGGNGFAYDAGKVTAAYAKINDSETDGYLSRPRRAVATHIGWYLTFYYDAVDRSALEQSKMAFAIEDLDPTNLPWVGEAKYVGTIEFDASFADYRPTSCENWFARTGVSSIKGLANLDVSQATSLAGMFSNCYALVELDLTHFETPAVTNIAHMFSNCGKLTTIYASSHFTTNMLMCGAEPVFDGSTKLVGGAGAAYDSQKVSAAYAHIGTGATPDGYFTEPRPIAKAVYDSTQAKMTFYYDMLDHEAEGEVFPVTVASASSNPAWYSKDSLKSSVTEVVFDASFADYRPTVCFRWFHGFTALTTLTGLENLNVSEATTLREMFSRCTKLTTLDLSSFDTHKVTTMNNMFYQCYDLVTIYASTDFVTTALTTPTENVFDTCTNLVGGAGTAYKTETSTSGRKRAAYACIDDPQNDKPGYFTERGRTAVAVVATDGKTLSFYCDSADHSSEGTVYPIADAEAQDPSVSAPWSGAAGTVTNVVFARSFANYAPQHCGSWFSGFKKLTKIDGLANLNLGQATSLKNMFYNCSALTALDFSDVSVGSKVTDCFGMFSGCSGLTALNLRRFITGAVTDMTKMFNGCSSLTTLDLYSFQTANVTSMMNMFADCSALETILVSSGFATSGLADASKPVFYGCTALKGGAGSVCDGYENVSAAYAKVDGGESAPGYLTKKRVALAVVSGDAKTLTFFYDTDDHAGATATCLVEDAEENPDEAPRWTDYRSSVTRVVIDASFADYRPKSCNEWFSLMSNVRKFDGLENLDVSQATSLRMMFYGCDNVSELDLRTWNTSSVTDMTYMFACTTLKAIYASSAFTTLALTDPHQAVFLRCYNLKGEQGTAFDWTASSAQYARIDAAEAQGYFSRKPTAVAVHSIDNRTLTFYYDAEDHAGEGDVYAVVAAEAEDPSVAPPWGTCRTQTSTVVFDASFANYQPKHCGMWFYNFGSVKEFAGMENLDVSRATSLACMFYGCGELVELDASHFNTASAMSMADMFSNCTHLKTIYATSAFTKVWAGAHETMFENCSDLVGEFGTAYRADRITTEYARLDDPARTDVGYFTRVPSATAVYTASAGTLVFYHDAIDRSGAGVTVFAVADAEALTGDEKPAWAADAIVANVTSVSFADSFAQYQPKSCHRWFDGFANVTAFAGLDNIDVSEATDLAYLFAGCASVESLDLADFNTANVVDMTGMFDSCTALTTVYATGGFSTSALTNAEAFVFNTNPNLVGGKGTAYADANRGAAYARLDKAPSAPGYFTRLPEAVAVWSSATKTLTFRYDAEDYGVKGTDWFSVSDQQKDGLAYPAHRSRADVAENVVFDASFATFRPTTCQNWFSTFAVLKSVTGLENLNVSETVNFTAMFKGCGELTALDLSTFAPAQAKYMSKMFENCAKLKCIEASDRFQLPLVEQSASMFAGCTALVGGAGTVYDAGEVDMLRAVVDSPEMPGYFTGKYPNGRAMAVLSDGGTKLTFRYGSADYGMEGIDWFAFADDGSAPGYSGVGGTVAKVEIDYSFRTVSLRHLTELFKGFGSLTYIGNLKYLDTRSVVDMRELFASCSTLETLDLGTFDTANVTNFAAMFQNCTSLATIYASSKFVVDGSDCTDMFDNCSSLQGGQNTTVPTEPYDPADYARIDGGPEAPGLFTVRTVDFSSWAAEQGLVGDDAAWDAKPARWGGKWANAFIYTYGEGLAAEKDATPLMEIGFDANGLPVITTAPELDGRSGFTAKVLGTLDVSDWKTPVELVRDSGTNAWSLPAETEANFFKVQLSN